MLFKSRLWVSESSETLIFEWKGNRDDAMFIIFGTGFHFLKHSSHTLMSSSRLCNFRVAKADEVRERKVRDRGAARSRNVKWSHRRRWADWEGQYLQKSQETKGCIQLGSGRRKNKKTLWKHGERRKGDSHRWDMNRICRCYVCLSIQSPNLHASFYTSE